MKKIVRNVVVTALIGLFATTAQAFDPEGGDSAQGKDAFTSKCRSCHNGSKAVNLSPAQKTQKQWSRYFAKDFKKLKKKMPDFDSYGIPEKELEHILAYLVSGALDSAKPQTCE
jgi:hypothetical protein